MGRLAVEDYYKYLSNVLSLWSSWENVPPLEGLTRTDFEAQKQGLEDISRQITEAEGHLAVLQEQRRLKMKAVNRIAPRLRTLVLTFYGPDSQAAKLLPVLYHTQTLHAAQRRARVKKAKAETAREAEEGAGLTPSSNPTL